MINVNLTAGKGESIQHSTIKSYLINFLRDSKRNNIKTDIVSWRDNRYEPTFSIWEEYPFFDKTEEYEHNLANDKYFDLWENTSDQELWTYVSQYTKKNNIKIKYIADIAVQSCGGISDVFEIVKCNPPSKTKLNFYKENNITCYVVNAFALYELLLRKGQLREKDFKKHIKIAK